MANITPSVGRKVWYYGNNEQAEPCDATVIKVHGDIHTPESPVNLFVIGQEGDTFVKTEVTVGDDKTEGTHYRWMPYQQQRAAEQASQKL